jgi:signal transduction histidine kinase
MAKLIQQLLDVSKIENGKLVYDKQEVDFREFVEVTSEALVQLVPTHHVSVSCEGSCKIVIDKMRIEQVLNNLVSNAAKYSPPGKSIRIKTRVADGLATVWVEDDGIGMSQETVKSIFGKFFRDEGVMKKYSGLGMGLYIASRIIADHKGTMNVTSTEGKGSIVSFSLPLL